VIHYASFFGRGPGPDWSPDGRTIAVPVRLQSTASRWVLDTISVADGRIRELYSSSVEYINFGHPVWLPGGDVLLVPHFDSASHRIQLWTISFPDGVTRRFTNDLADYDTGDLDITRDGRTVSAIAETGLYNIWGRSRCGPFESQADHFGRIADDLGNRGPGRQTTIGRLGFRSLGMNLDGSQRAPFGDIHGADWPTTCGHFVLFVGSIGGGFLMRVDADGTHATQLVNRNVISPIEKSLRFHHRGYLAEGWLLAVGQERIPDTYRQGMTQRLEVRLTDQFGGDHFAQADAFVERSVHQKAPALRPVKFPGLFEPLVSEMSSADERSGNFTARIKDKVPAGAPAIRRRREDLVEDFVDSSV